MIPVGGARSKRWATTSYVNSKVSPANTAIVFGNSFSNRNWQTSGTLSYRWMDYGYFTWANILLGNPFRMVGNYGVAGETTTQMLARTSTAIAVGAAWVFLEGGVNDVSAGATAATIVANLKELCNRFVNAGSRVVLMAITPYTGYSGGYTTILTVNARMREWAARNPGVIYVDTYAALVNPTDTTGALASGMSDDALHPSCKGARAYGQAIANALAYQVPAHAYLPSSAAGAYAIDPLSSQILTNPLMSGSGGTVSGTGASGTIATSWTGGTDTGTVTSVFLHGQARSDAIGVDQQVTITNAGSGAIVNMRQTGMQARVTSGDTIYAVGSISLTGQTDVAAIYPGIELTMDSTAYAVRILDPSLTTWDQSDLTFNFRTPEFLLSGASITALSFFLRVRFGTSGAGAATLKVGRLGLYKY